VKGPTEKKIAARSTGLLPHLRRLALNLATPDGARGLLREGSSLLTHVVRYPLGLVGAPVQPHDHGAEMTYETPVVMVHGYFHNRSGFLHLTRELHGRGFRWVQGMNYNPLGSSVPDLADRFAGHVSDVMAVSGGARGRGGGGPRRGGVAPGVVEVGGGDEVVDTCVTIGTPHEGTLAAYLGFGRAARDMRPDSEVVQRLATTFVRSRVKYANLYSDLDVLIIPPHSAVLPDRTGVHNHLIDNLGHTSLLVSDELIEQVADHLVDAETGEPALAEVRELRRRA
jgi:triacylglycerol lipase